MIVIHLPWCYLQKIADIFMGHSRVKKGHNTIFSREDTRIILESWCFLQKIVDPFIGHGAIY